MSSTPYYRQTGQTDGLQTIDRQDRQMDYRLQTTDRQTDRQMNYRLQTDRCNIDYRQTGQIEALDIIQTTDRAKRWGTWIGPVQ